MLSQANGELREWWEKKTSEKATGRPKVMRDAMWRRQGTSESRQKRLEEGQKRGLLQKPKEGDKGKEKGGGKGVEPAACSQSVKGKDKDKGKGNWRPSLR